MTKKATSYSTFQKAAAGLLMVVLCWLTISGPFVRAAQQELAKHQKALAKALAGSSDENNDSNSNNSIEEKGPNTASFAEEFLHDHHYSNDCFFTEISTFHKTEDADCYHAYHDELLVPPPNAA